MRRLENAKHMLCIDYLCIVLHGYSYEKRMVCGSRILCALVIYHDYSVNYSYDSWNMKIGGKYNDRKK